MSVVVLAVVVILGPTLPNLRDPDAHRGPRRSRQRALSLRARARQFDGVLRQPAVWRLVVAICTISSLSLVANQATTNANAAWFHITPLQLGLSSCLQVASDQEHTLLLLLLLFLPPGGV